MFNEVKEKIKEESHVNWSEYDRGYNQGLRKANRIIKQVAAEHNNGWIKCSDRLPDKQHDWVLVLCKMVPENYYGVPHIAELRSGVWHSDCHEGALEETASVKVVAWQPLPEPYKEGRE